MDELIYRAEDVKSTVCMAGTDFEHQVYWLENKPYEVGDPTYVFRYLTKEEKEQFAVDKLVIDNAATQRRKEEVLAAQPQPLTLDDM